MLPTLLFSTAIVFGSLVLLAWHVKSWREADHGGLAERDQKFFRRQYRRRMQSSGMLGIIGLLIPGHLWVRDNTMLALYWTGVLGLLIWTMLLAVSDFASSRLHYGTQVANQQTEHLLLKREIEKFRQETGSPPSTDPTQENE